MEVFWGDVDENASSELRTRGFQDISDDCTASASAGTSSSTIAPLFSVTVPETRKITKITGHAPNSAILTEVEARREINVCRAPPKNIPGQLKRDFLTGRKNAAQCLNEACQLQRWNIKYIETAPSKPFDSYGRSNFANTAIVNGVHYTPGEGHNKKEAKAEGARNALNEILGLNPDQDRTPYSVKECDTYGREIPLHKQLRRTSVSMRDRPHQPIPRAVHAQKTSILPTDKSASTEKQNKEPPLPHESVAILVERKICDLLLEDATLFDHFQHGVVSAFLVKKDNRPCEVVSLGTGDMCFHGGELITDGTVVFDCHAETVARRAFRRYLLNQLRLWHSGNENLRLDCIFEQLQETSLLCIKDEVTIYLYMNKLPKGLARSDKKAVSGSVNGEWNLTFLRNAGCLETRVMPNAPVVINASDVLSMTGKKMPTMSGSDKIMKWSVCGIQGSLLSLFIEPIYLENITIGCDSDICDCEALSAAVNRRLNVSFSVFLPGMFSVNHVDRIESCLIKPKPVEVPLKSKKNLSANWTKGDAKVEIIEASCGKVDDCSPTGTPGGRSRLSKAAFYLTCQQFVRDTETSPVRSENYHTTKQSSLSYQETKRRFHVHINDKGFGRWISRPEEVDCFRG